MQKRIVHIPTLEQVHRPIRAGDIDILKRDITARSLARANNITRIRTVCRTCHTRHVLNYNITYCQGRWVFVAERQVFLTVALGDFDGVVDVADGHGVVCDIIHISCAAASLKVSGEGGWAVGPHLYACHVRSVEH